MWSYKLWAVFSVLTVVAGATSQSCLQGVNCHLPKCFCSTDTISMPKEEIPQIVYFGFDDALNTEMAKHYRRLFAPDRLNPNGCPVSMTLYVQDQYTSYKLVSEFYKRGMEIGVHSVTHTNIDTADKLMDEADQQRQNLAIRGQVPIKEIVGWRSPNLKTAGDAQPDVLQRLGYTYDISLTYTRRKFGTEKPWPYTLDNGYPYTCMILPCPNSSHAGFWEVPVNSLVDYKNEYPCPYVDGCYNRADTEERAFKYLLDNFKDYYEDSRTPLGFNMHAAWFNTPHNIKAMDRFIKHILLLPGVYILSVQKMLDWVKQPTPLSRIQDVQSWNCGLKLPTSNTKTTTTTSTTTTTTTPVPPPRPRPPPPASSSQVCVQGGNCELPECFCRTTEPPLEIPREKTPQMVYFTFDGPINLRTYVNLLQLFKNRKNSNNCPISATLFVSISGNNVNYLDHLLAMGMEVGLRGDSTDAYRSSETLGIDLDRELAYLEASLPGRSYKGWRSPAVKSLGDEQFRLVKSHGLLYDSTLRIRASAPSSDLPWPYTLDFRWQDGRQINSNPQEKYPGLWEIPVAPVLDYRRMYPCTYVDGCMFNPPTAPDTFNFLWSNFKDRYYGNRAPLGIALRQQWFSHPVYKPNLEGLDRFIQQLVSMPDVYVVSIEKVIDWIRNPTSLQDLPDFAPWQCS